MCGLALASWQSCRSTPGSFLRCPCGLSRCLPWSNGLWGQLPGDVAEVGCVKKPCAVVLGVRTVEDVGFEEEEGEENNYNNGCTGVRIGYQPPPTQRVEDFLRGT
mmetsp:Transcript_28813/g.56334  ORF Transcript_28813/g.56334 Transcript_28813/m.56334 type:complete len:105 (-) Transcript_28813:118-432(-)